MAWTAPRTWVAAETLTAALLNTHVRDNLLETATAKVTTAGDLTYATGANALTRLALGTAGAIFVAGASAPRWSSAALTAAAGLAININLSNSALTAAANGDILISLDNGATYATGTKTGLVAYGIYAPGGNMTKTGTGTIDTAYNVYLSVPAIATANWTLYINDGNSRLGGTSSSVYIGDTANANMTAGLTINQGAATNEMLAGKQSSVAHGITTYAETDTAWTMGIQSTSGGALLAGYTGSNTAIQINGSVTSEDSTRSTAAVAPIKIIGLTKSGTGTAAMSANTNIMTIGISTGAQFVFDSDGDSHENGTGWTAYDDFDDLALLNALDNTLDKRLSAQAGAWLRENKAALQAARIVAFNDDTDGIPFINKSRLGMLHTGAIRQVGVRLKSIVERLELVERKLALVN